jgi:2-C-methyl-D-erythritol 4-phosphate cytidylyltransferase
MKGFSKNHIEKYINNSSLIQSYTPQACSLATLSFHIQIFINSLSIKVYG